mmetsp:Transcript_12781/g.23979  ORF Transcript_12781/g.23979 Transcript_12781/m.23979 type:complete len:356 (+) Transcript_12781:171-1238(+)|eukprot:CAMPEP_0176498080 /NCGR_PEP_ID=MMETSP0200_2-20121128/12108_1 /TAXON_ID=947934 /ORGANISM="Chaetoceros sp., Strain GSL56" /LENGTH=355 /DNA_ID=CAMNT_0017896219 /DNA_START=118 /DNA_END=1185 /DNA_ORIENTATION=+
MNQPPQGDPQDLYSILNLPRDASQSQIKTAYRKLALKYHPDRQSSPEEKQKCTEIFTKIGNAYEVLGNPKRRKTYDRYGIMDDHDVNSSRNDASSARNGFHSPFNGGFFGGRRDPFQDPFFTGGGRGNDRFGGFMDPFEIFQSFFGDEFSHEFHNEDYLRGHNDRRNQNRQGNGMNGFGFGGGGAFGSPWGGSSGFGNFMGMGFGHHMDAMNSMMNQLHQQNSQPGFSSSSYSSSTSYGGNSGGGVQESVTTSTRIINGKRQTITERVRVNPDGSVERHTETSGDDDFQSTMQHLGYNDHARNTIENGNVNRFLPESHREGETNQEKTQRNTETVEEGVKQHKKRRFFRRKNDEA